MLKYCSFEHKEQTNLKQNLYIYIQQNAFKNVVGEMAAILSRHECVYMIIPMFYPANLISQ